MLTSLFGTDGIRKKVGVSPLTAQELHHLGYTLGAWMCSHHATPRILIAQDPRESSPWITTTLQSGLLLHNVHIACTRVLPSPAVAYLLRYSSQFDYGIIVSASHNPYYDNGIKILDKHTLKLSADDENEITKLYHQKFTVPYARFGKIQPLFEAQDIYFDALTSYFPDNFLTGKKIVLDCAHGALYKLAEIVFKHFGATTITLYNEPNGQNINYSCGTTNPSALSRAVIEHQADAGFAFDGDGDRVIAVNKHGKLCDGDDILALLSTSKQYQTDTIVGTIMSNYNFENYLQSKGKKLIRAQVGDKHVAQHMNLHQLPLGGEPSGHIIIRDYLATGDGLYVALQIMQTIIETDNYEMKTFDKFPHILINIPIRIKKNLETGPVSSIIKKSEQDIKNGRIYVRYSGTESKLRILVEEENHTLAETIAARLAHQLSEQLG